MEQPGVDLATIWDIGTAGGSLASYAVALAPEEVHTHEKPYVIKSILSNLES